MSFCFDNPNTGTSTGVAGICLMLLALLAYTSPRIAAADSLEAEQRCLALAIYFEARGEGRQGMIAVGWTVLNRTRNDAFPSTPCQVVHQGGETPPCQFSWWCDGKSDRPRDTRSWRLARMIAADLLANPPPDPTDGSLYFHGAGMTPPWRRTRTASIGRHVFYR